MFEVSKKYVWQGNRRDYHTFEVLLVGDQYAFIRYESGQETIIPNKTFPAYEEVKEPKKVKGWINIFNPPIESFNLWSTRERANEVAESLRRKYNRVACKEIEIEYFEGEGL